MGNCFVNCTDKPMTADNMIAEISPPIPMPVLKDVKAPVHIPASSEPLVQKMNSGVNLPQDQSREKKDEQSVEKKLPIAPPSVMTLPPAPDVKGTQNTDIAPSAVPLAQESKKDTPPVKENKAEPPKEVRLIAEKDEKQEKKMGTRSVEAPAPIVVPEKKMSEPQVPVSKQEDKLEPVIIRSDLRKKTNTKLTNPRENDLFKKRVGMVDSSDTKGLTPE